MHRRRHDPRGGSGRKGRSAETGTFARGTRNRFAASQGLTARTAGIAGTSQRSNSMSYVNNVKPAMLGVDALTQAADAGIGGKARRPAGGGGAASRIEAMAGARGQALDKQAAAIAELFEPLNPGPAQP